MTCWSCGTENSDEVVFCKHCGARYGKTTNGARTLFYNCYSYVEFYHKKNKTIAIATCVAAAINIITNFIFIPKFGYIAAAYKTILGYLVLSILHAITSFKILKINIIPLKSILAFCLALLVSVMVVVVSYNSLILRIVIIISLFVLIVIFRKYICKICLQILRK